MMLQTVLLEITLTVSALLNAFLNLKNLMALGLNLLILKKLNISFHCSPLCALLLFGLLLLELTILETSIITLLKYVILKGTKIILLLEFILISI